MSSSNDPTLPGTTSASLDDNGGGETGDGDSEELETGDLDTFMRLAAEAPPIPLPGSDPSVLALGSVIDGSYRIVAPLGQGGMGAVFIAEHLELKRRLAIKVHRRHDSESDNAALLGEARAMAKLSHANVVAVHGSGLVDGRVYIAMEYVEGTTLRQWMTADRTWRQTVDMFAAIARGLEAAHQADLVHRDFKPDNVLLDSTGRPRVADFGLARTVAGPDTAQAAAEVTDRPSKADAYEPTAGIVGTPPYMSPEQFDGLPLDARSDQYSFCVVLYESLYGRRPHDGGSVFEMREAIVEGHLRPPPRGVAPRWLGRVVMRGLAVRPEDRFTSMAELGAALTPNRRPKLRRRLAAVAALGVAGAVVAWVIPQTEPDACAAVGKRLADTWGAKQAKSLAQRLAASGVGAASTYSPKLERTLDSWVLEWTEAARQACRAAGTDAPADSQEFQQACLRRTADHFEAGVELMLSQAILTPTGAQKVVARLPAVSRCALQPTSRTFDPPPADQTESVESLRADLGRAAILVDMGLIPTALEVSASVLDQAKSLGYRPLQTEALFAVGSAHYANGNADLAEAAFVDAYHLADELGYEDLAGMASARLVSTLGVLGRDPQKAAQWTRHATTAAERLDDQAVLQELHSALGNFEAARGDLERAATHHRASLALAQDATPVDKAGVSRALVNLGAVLRDRGQRDEALALFERSLEFESGSSGDAANRAAVLHNIGGVLSDLGRGAEAELRLEQALELKTEWLGETHPALASTLDGLGGLRLDRRDFEGARDAFASSLRIRKDALGADHPDVADSHTNLANALDELGQSDEAIEHQQRALALVEATYGPDHPRVGLINNNLGDTLTALGRHAEARVALARSLANWSSVLGDEHPLIVHPLLNLATLDLKERRPEAAKPRLERALAIAQSQDVDVALVGEVRFALARTLWESGEEPKARAVAEAARANFVDAGDRSAHELSELDAWRTATLSN